MVDQFTRTSRQGYFSRLINSFVGVLIGLLMIPGSVLLLSWNEYRTIHRTTGLTEAEKVVEEVPDSMEIDSKNEGKLVHLGGIATTEEVLADDVFSVSLVALQLERSIEMFQWVEHKESKSRDKLGGGRETVTTYSYDRKWHAGHVNSDSFEEKTGHTNPLPKYSEKRWTTRQGKLGAYELRPDLVDQIDNWKPVPVDLATLIEKQDDETKKHFSLDVDKLYFGVNGPKPSSPEVGDLRIQFRAVAPTQVSVLSAQKDRKLQPYKTSNGESVESLALGTVSAADMFNSLKQANTMIAMLLRILGWVLACVGIGMVIGPIKSLANVIPFLSQLVGIATFAIAFIIGSAIALLTIAFAWVAVRPIYSIALIALAALGLYVLLRKRKPAEPPMAVLVE